MKICLVLDAKHFQENIFLIHKSTDRLGKKYTGVNREKMTKSVNKNRKQPDWLLLARALTQKTYILRQTASIGLI